MEASWLKYRLDFRFTAITSRDRLSWKDTYYIKVYDPQSGNTGIGEAGLFRGLSADDRPDYEERLGQACRDIDRYVAQGTSELAPYPSIRFGIETAIADLRNGGRRMLYDTPWSRGETSLTTNGLIWMGDKATMGERLEAKLAEGFRCIKIKIGGIDFGQELELLSYLRSIAPGVELRLDANGAFHPSTALDHLEKLAQFDIHSIEQPIRQGQWEEMARICKESPIPVALDEELIGLHDPDLRRRMLDIAKPAYIILKPTLTGGFEASDEWISLARERNIGWWATSALESNIGLNAIAQWVATYDPTMPQGLGTGQLYHNNIPSPLTLRGESLYLDTEKKWEISI